MPGAGPLLILSGVSVAGTCPQHSKRFLKALTKEKLLEAKHSGPRLCVDLSMTHHMSKKVDYSDPDGGMEGSSLCEGVTIASFCGSLVIQKGLVF